MQDSKNNLFVAIRDLDIFRNKEISEITNFSTSYDVSIFKVTISLGDEYIVKYGKPRIKEHFNIEANMLNYLKEKAQLNVPDVFYSDYSLLLMGFIEGGSSISPHHQRQMARILANLHSHKAEKFGFDYDTTIGALPQPNKKFDSWVEFFKNNRVLFMAKYAFDKSAIDHNLLLRIERFADLLDKYLDEPDYPSLIHGDIWSGNVICNNNEIAGLIDPAIYYAHPEIELAFMTMFGTFSNDFFTEYANLRKFDKSFFEIRRDIYNIYPLLVHVLLCGSSYVYGIEKLLKRLGI